MRRVIQRGPHQARGRQGRVQPGVVHHFDDRLNTRALVPDAIGRSVVILDLGRGIGPVAQLILEPHQPDRITLGVQPPGHQKAGQPTRRLRQRQKPVRHRRGTEPLVPRQPVGFTIGAGNGGIGAQVRAALLFRHRHSHRRARFARHWHGRPVIGPRDQFGHPLREDRRVRTQRGNRRIGHRHRAANAGLDLAGQIDHGGMGRVPALAAFPGNRGIARADPGLQQAMVVGMKPHLVQPPPTRVKGQQLGWLPIGGTPGRSHVACADHRGIAFQMRRGGPVRPGVIAQRHIIAPQVQIAPVMGLVGDVVTG